MTEPRPEQSAPHRLTLTKAERAREQFTGSMFTLMLVATTWAVVGGINVGTIVCTAAFSGVNALIVWKMR